MFTLLAYLPILVNLLIWVNLLILVNLRIVVNLVILKKSADSDETDDSMYAVDSSDRGEYGKYC